MSHPYPSFSAPAAPGQDTRITQVATAERLQRRLTFSRTEYKQCTRSVPAAPHRPSSSACVSDSDDTDGEGGRSVKRLRRRSSLKSLLDMTKRMVLRVKQRSSTL